MLADLAALILDHYDSLLLLMLAGACFVLAGMLFIFIVRRRDVVLGEPDVPTWTEPATSIPLPPRAASRREDQDTHVIPSIPGATPELQRFVQVVEETAVALEGLRVIPHEERDEKVSDELLQRFRDRLKAPVCPTCGGPFGNCSCYSQKSSSDSEATQVVDLCPLTTQDIAVPSAEPVPEYDTTVQRADTQELSAHMEKIRRRERVA